MAKANLQLPLAATLGTSVEKRKISEKTKNILPEFKWIKIYSRFFSNNSPRRANQINFQN